MPCDIDLRACQRDGRHVQQEAEIVNPRGGYPVDISGRYPPDIHRAGFRMDLHCSVLEIHHSVNVPEGILVPGELSHGQASFLVTQFYIQNKGMMRSLSLTNFFPLPLGQPITHQS